MKSVALSFLVGAVCPAVAFAQVTHVASDRTIAGGNPVNAPITGAAYIGRNSSEVNVGGVDADFVSGASVSGALVGYSDSVTNIFAGTYGGIIAADTSRITVGAVTNNGGYRVEGNGRLTVAGGTAHNVSVGQNGAARINGGFFATPATFTILEASGSGAALELAGGTTIGVVRASVGGVTRVSGGNYGTLHSLPGGLIEVFGGLPANGARLAALNRGAGDANRGRFTLFGTNLSLTNPIAGSYFDPTYLISNPGVFYTLTGTLENGQAINAQYFEEGISVTQQPTQIQIATTVPEASTLVLCVIPVIASGIILRRKTSRKNS